MFIKHLTGPKAGTSEHLPPNVGQVLVAAGFAEALPRPRYGTSEFKRERQALAKFANGRMCPHDVMPTFYKEPEWYIHQNTQYSEILVGKRIGFEILLYSQPPADCPAEIAAQFRALHGKRR